MLSQATIWKKQVVHRSFKPNWFDLWSWIHYDEASDSAFCHLCVSAEKVGKLRSSLKGSAFLEKGFTNWKDTTEGFRRHEKSKCHGDAVQVMVILPETVHDVGESLSSAHVKNKEENREVLLKILQNMKFLRSPRFSFAWT